MTEDFVKAYKVAIAQSGGEWSPYFPVRVELTRRDLHRAVLGLHGHAATWPDKHLNAAQEVGDDYRQTAVNLDSALKFHDQNFVLITKDEYDKLIASAKPSEPPVQEPAPVEVRQESTVSHD